MRKLNWLSSSLILQQLQSTCRRSFWRRYQRRSSKLNSLPERLSGFRSSIRGHQYAHANCHQHGWNGRLNPCRCRVNPDLLPDLLTSIQTSQQNLTTATQELASGQSVNQLSDNPEAVAQLVQNHNQSSQDDQFLQNLSTLQSRFQVADSTLSDVVAALTQALSVGTEGANGTLSASDRQAIAGEVQGVQSQILGLANTSSQGVYLFVGTATSAQPFAVNSSTGAVTYNGNANTTSVQLSNGNSIQGNLPGSQLFLNGAGSVFGALQDLNTALTSGNNIGAAVSKCRAR